MDQQQEPRWQPTRRQLLWAAGATVGLVLLTIAVVIGYRYDITLWDWIKLLVVPAVIAGGGLLFSVQQREREQRIASERAEDEALQAYLDGMSQLLTDKERPLHEAQPGDSLSTVARARTLTILARLGSGRKRSVLQFLYESGLISKGRPVLALQGADLRGADLRGADLIGANLSWANLSGAFLSGAFLSEADLRGADLRGAYLREANYLSEANLSDANLSGAFLSEAFLRGANLSWANLSEANLSWANLSEADLIGANLRGADLSRANLSWANLSKAFLSEADLIGANLGGAYLRDADLSKVRSWTAEQLSAAISLEGATMPDGQTLEGATMPDGQTLKSDDNSDEPTFEEWLKSKRSGEDEKNE